MKANEVVELLQDAVKQVQQDGTEHVPVTTLTDFISRIGDAVAETPDGIGIGEAAMERYKADLSSWMASQQHQHDFNLEMLRSVITTGQTALKSALLINGGAAAALLAFMGGIWNAASAQQVVPSLSLSLACFVWGVLAAAVSSGATYISQAGYGEDFGRASMAVGATCRVIAILSVVASYALFARGAWLSFIVFQSAHS